jgi:hypothetical protein
MAKVTIKAFDGEPMKSGMAFHGGFQPQSKVQKGYQPQGSGEVPQSVPKLVSGVVSPSTNPTVAPPSQPVTDGH